MVRRNDLQNPRASPASRIEARHAMRASSWRFIGISSRSLSLSLPLNLPGISAGIHTLEQQPQRERPLAEDGDGNDEGRQSRADRGRNKARERADYVARAADYEHGTDDPRHQRRTKHQ